MSFFKNTREPVGLGGKLMVAMMNIGHRALADWGLSFMRPAKDASVLDCGCGGGANIKKLLAHRHDLLLREHLRGHPPRHEQGRDTGVHPSSQPLSPHRLFRLCTDEWRSERKILCTGEESFAKGT